MSVPVAELLQQLNTLGEDARIEAKSAHLAGHSILETICAFANEPGLDGGYLLLGVAYDDSTGEYRVEGVPNPEKVQADVATQCASAFNRPLRPTFWTEEIAGKRVIEVFVPELQPQEKPLYFRNQGLPRGAFRRTGTTDQRCTEDDLLVFYQDQQHGTYDETPVQDAQEGDIDPQALADYRRYREQADPDAEELRWSDADLLYALGCASRVAGRLVPTVAGLLLFGIAPALRRYFPMMRVDYIRVPGREWVSNPDRRFETIEMRSPLITLIGRIRAAILDDLPRAFSLPVGRVQREDLPIIPDRVIREAVVNAVMHRNYRTHGAVQIIRYANRLEIRNPGQSLIAEDQLGEPGSKTRNPKIAAVLHETRFAETKGSGIRVMREMMVDAGLSPPTFESNRGRDEFVATLLLHHFLDPEDMAWLANFREYALSDEEARALVFVRETGAIGNGAYRDLNRVDTLTARRGLRRLRDLGLLEQKGKGFDTYYVATPRLAQPTLPTAVHEVAAAPTPAVQMSLPAVQTVESALDSVEFSGESVESAVQSGELPPLPAELAALVSATRGRATTDTVRSVIRQLCAWRPLGSGAIAGLLDRKQAYVQERYLRPMVRDGELAYTFPEHREHPRQAYRAVEQEER